MKKGIAVLIIVGIIFFFTGSSPWEGAAAVAPAGELPESGFFVATNSFPRNTIVDITNIETGRTTRVIVANTLSNSGLLAIVSREAAELIGMRAGSVSRVRIVQPSDPMAYARFAERLASGAPYIDPAITEEGLLNELYSEDTYIPPAAQPSVTSAPAPAHSSYDEIADLNVERGYIVDEPEWGGSGRLNIVEIPGYVVEPVPFAERPPERITELPYIIQSEQIARETDENVTEPAHVSEVTETEEPVYVTEVEVPAPQKEPVHTVEAEEPVYVTYMDYPGAGEEAVVTMHEPAVAEVTETIEEPVTPVYITQSGIETESPVSEEIIKDVSQRIEETPPVYIVKDIPGFIEEILPEDIFKEHSAFAAVDDSQDEIIKEPSEFIAEIPREEIIKDIDEWTDPVYVADVPEDIKEEPPIAEIPAQITEIPRGAPVPLVPVESVPRIPGHSVYDIPLNDIIPGIIAFEPEKIPPSVIPETVVIPPVTVTEIPQKPVIPETAVIPSVEPVVTVQSPSAVTIQPEPAVAPVPVVIEPLFTARTISQLDRGQYYVQLAALHAEMIDNTIRQIDPRYNPVVLRDRDNLFRVLIGPLNQGESAAVLQRFKSIGYSDAFVRYGN